MRNFKILIADDEQTIRKGIVAMIKSSITYIDIDFIEASNGNEALNASYQESPDLIISDIRMPGCSGLEFIEKLRRNRNSPKVLILSGYSEFEYAKTAISLDVGEYILKPIKKQEFISLVSKYIKEVTEEKNRKLKEIRKESSVERAEAQMQQFYLLRLLESTDEDASIKIKQILNKTGIDFTTRPYSCSIIQAKVTAENRDFITFGIKNISEEILNGLECEIILTEIETGMICVIYTADSMKDIKHQSESSMKDLLLALINSLEIDIYISVGKPVMSYLSLNESYVSAKTGLLNKLIDSSSKSVVYEKLKITEKHQMINIEKEISNITELSSDRISNIINSIIYEGSSVETLESLEILYGQIDDHLKKYIILNENIDKEEKKDKSIYTMWNSFELKRYLNKQINIAKQTFEDKSRTTGKNLSKEIVGYIKKNATEDINLNIIANIFSRTPEYLSGLIKKETGKSFTEIHNEERIDFAKKILKSSNTPISEISVICGYVNSKHFSSVFKKYTGISPSEYRANM